MNNFEKKIMTSYNFDRGSFGLGVAIDNGEIQKNIQVKIPLTTLNRHGLVSGATGTGKTKTIQKILESLSEAGIPSVIMDMKGDVSGLAMPGIMTEKTGEYLEKIGNPEWNPKGFPVEFFSLLGEGGSQIRATVSEFGPSLISRIMGLSDTQSSAMSVIFSYADDKGLLLVDLEDLKAIVSFLTQNKEELANYGYISPTSLQVIMRQIVALESTGTKTFFSEKSLDIIDLLKVDENGKGQINVFRLMNSLRSPQIFTTMMIQLLGEFFNIMPEVGDKGLPKGIIVIDEASLFFKDLSKNLLKEIETIIKLIRSKGIGIIFCTQNPNDIPEEILSQLGLKVQHALRAFTAKDNDTIKKMVKNFPLTEFYSLQNDITNLGTGQAFITTIGEDGRPTEVVMTQIYTPESRMDVISDSELAAFLSVSKLFSKYKDTINPESASEILKEKIEKIAKQKEEEKLKKEQEKNKGKSLTSIITKNTTKSVGTEIARKVGTSIGGKKVGTLGAQIARGILGSIFR